MELTEELTIEMIFKEPKYFFLYCTGSMPADYQEAILGDRSKDIIFRAGRQVGKSTVLAIKAIYEAVVYSSRTIIILAPTREQAQIIFWKILEWINADEYLKSFVVSQSQTMLFLRNGSQIRALPHGKFGFNIRGFDADMIIVDEAAYLGDDVFNAITPSRLAKSKLAGTGYLIYSGTPFGKRGKFWEAWNDDEFSHYFVKSSESPITDKNLIEKERARLPELEFKQEYEGEFIEEVDVFFTRELILKCIHPE